MINKFFKAHLFDRMLLTGNFGKREMSGIQLGTKLEMTTRLKSITSAFTQRLQPTATIKLTTLAVETATFFGRKTALL